MQQGVLNETYLSGYVTSLETISGLKPRELEHALGFNEGALAKGYTIYELVAPITLDDLQWADQTRYSDGWHYDRSINEYVPRHAELRAHFGKVTGYNEAAADAQIKRVLERKLAVLKSGKIVKVRPTSKPDAFPDSPMRNVPQWKLQTSKRFRLLAEVPPDAACPLAQKT